MDMPAASSRKDSPEAKDKPTFERVKLVLFDLDGTLVDSVGDLAWCGNEMLRTLEMPLQDPQAARNWVGNGLERFVKRVLTNDMIRRAGRGPFPHRAGNFQQALW